MHHIDQLLATLLIQPDFLALKKQGRKARQGLVASYQHNTKDIDTPLFVGGFLQFDSLYNSCIPPRVYCDNSEITCSFTKQLSRLCEQSMILRALCVYMQKPDVSGINEESRSDLLYGILDHLQSHAGSVSTIREALDLDTPGDSFVGCKPSDLVLWQRFFAAYETEQKNKTKKIWVPAWLLGFLYGAVEGLGAAIGMVALFSGMGVGGVPLIVASIAIGLVAAYTNFEYSRGLLKNFLHSMKRIFQDLGREDWKLKGRAVVFSLVCGLAAVVTGAGAGYVIREHFMELAHLFINSSSTAAFNLSAVVPTIAIAVMAVAICVELCFFIKACLELYRQGGPWKVIKETLAKALKDEHGNAQWLATVTLVFLVLCNLTGIALLSTGSVGGLKNIMGLSSQAAAIAMVVVAGFGLLAFYLRQSLGFAHGIDQARLVGWRKIVNAKNFNAMIMSHLPMVLGVVMLVASAASGVGAIGLAGMCVSIVLGIMWKKTCINRGWFGSAKGNSLVSLQRSANGLGKGMSVDAVLGTGIAVPFLAVSALSKTYVSEMPSHQAAHRTNHFEEYDTGLYIGIPQNQRQERQGYSNPFLP